MKLKTILFPVTVAALLWSCDQAKDQATVPDVLPAAPTAEVLAALEAQPIGGKLLGNTVRLVGDGFEAVDLGKAPEYYLVYYSASW